MTLPISVPHTHWHGPMGWALQEARRALRDDTPASPAPDVPTGTAGAVVLDSAQAGGQRNARGLMGDDTPASPAPDVPTGRAGAVVLDSAQAGGQRNARGLIGDDTPASPAPDVPIGAVVLDSSSMIIGRGHNTRERDNDPTGHAEVNAIREAAEHLGSWRLDGCTLVVTLEPCAMCAGTILLSRIPRLVIGAWDPKAGATGSAWDIVRDSRMNHFTEVIAGVREAECADLLREFFGSRRP